MNNEGGGKKLHFLVCLLHSKTSSPIPSHCPPPALFLPEISTTH